MYGTSAQPQGYYAPGAYQTQWAGRQNPQQNGTWSAAGGRSNNQRYTASHCCGCDCSSCCDCLDSDCCNNTSCDCNFLCCRPPYGKYGWRLNLAWAFGCMAVLLLVAAFYCSLVAGGGGLPSVANPDVWVDGWGLVLPIFIVTALAILPFSVMYCVLFSKRAREEERRALSGQGPQAIQQNSWYESNLSEDDDPPMIAAYFLTLSIVLGIIGLVMYAMGFGKINGKIYEGAKVIGVIMILAACVMLPLSSIFVVVNGRKRFDRYRGVGAQTYILPPPEQAIPRPAHTTNQGQGQQQAPPTAQAPPTQPHNPPHQRQEGGTKQPAYRVSFPTSSNGSPPTPPMAHTSQQQPQATPPHQPTAQPAQQQLHQTPQQPPPPYTADTGAQPKGNTGILADVKKGIGKGLLSLGSKLNK